ncbi:PREDICTED: transmembrane protein 39A isoform X2 [Polistes canadensis]|uniref:transmembrane protein 39A isoform X2 n=1 Tax=Polistes canadensis TaxID=91411 RepID=UPI000718ECEA|nr:PREDICTED: transmembrane protein 39A isoform X2 [Polistes canadensis]
MPSGRRNASGRSAPTSKSQSNLASSTGRSNSGDRVLGSGGDEKKLDDNYGKLLAPKHVPIPMVPVDGPLTFETLSLVVSVIAACLQLLNLYRTVWWLSHSYNSYSMNFYLIDPYLLIFIITMVARRFVYTLLRRLVDFSSPTRWFHIAQKLMRITLLFIVLSILLWCLYHMAERYYFMKLFYLSYPIFVYFFTFGMSISPFFDMSAAPRHIKEDKRMKYLLDTPLHNCSLSASAIRAEVSTFSSDFNHRLKIALYASFTTAYICGIAPIIFVPQSLHFNVQWVVQYVVLFWLGRISAHFAQAYPVRYCDVLHRAALHLGRWVKIENRNNTIYVQVWNEGILWPHGSIVKYNKETYRSEGLCTAAEPGNRSHYRFHIVFNNPTMLLCLLLGLQLLLVGTQLFILIRTTEWYQVLSMTLLLVINYYTLFKVTRDYLICWKVYRAEQIIQGKCQMNLLWTSTSDFIGIITSIITGI